MKRFSILLIAIQFLFAGCSLEKRQEGSAKEEKTTNSGEFKAKQGEETTSFNFETVTSDQAKEIILEENIVIIDVRKQESYSKAHIPNAQNIPLDELEGKLVEMDKNDTYLLVCKTGKTSEAASELLAKNGFNRLYNLSGGMDVWKGEVVN